jgi:hypothetical protein
MQPVELYPVSLLYIPVASQLLCLAFLTLGIAYPRRNVAKLTRLPPSAIVAPMNTSRRDKWLSGLDQKWRRFQLRSVTRKAKVVLQASFR